MVSNRQMKKADDPELAERLRQFEVVCRVAIHVSPEMFGTRGRKNGAAFIIHRMGEQNFGLTKVESYRCVGRVQRLLDRMERGRIKEQGSVKKQGSHAASSHAASSHAAGVL
jgi:hypothetical protein